MKKDKVDEEHKKVINIIKVFFMGLFVFMFCLAKCVGDSNYFTQKRYLEINELTYKGVILSKLEDMSINDDNRMKELLLDTNVQLRMSKWDYECLEIGDSIIKYKGDDNRYYRKKNGENWQEDLAAYLHSKLELKDK